MACHTDQLDKPAEVEEWICKEHTKYWQSIVGCRHSTTFIRGYERSRTLKLLKQNRNQLRWLVGLFTGHRFLKGYLYNIGNIVDSSCSKCHKADETAYHILYDCECLANTRAQILGNYFIKLDELARIPVENLVYIIKKTGLHWGFKYGDAQ